jgi:hypothetical protein
MKLCHRPAFSVVTPSKVAKAMQEKIEM